MVGGPLHWPGTFVKQSATPKVVHNSPHAAFATSVLQAVKYRIWALDPNPGVVDGELPIGLCFNVVAGSLLSGDLLTWQLDAVDAPVRALTDHDVGFDVGHVQPTAVPGVWMNSKQPHSTSARACGQPSFSAQVRCLLNRQCQIGMDRPATMKWLVSWLLEPVVPDSSRSQRYTAVPGPVERKRKASGPWSLGFRRTSRLATLRRRIEKFSQGEAGVNICVNG